MTSLTQLHEAISNLTKLDDKDEIQAGIEDIFYQLVYTAQPFYTVQTGKVPFTAPFPGDTQHRYLRLFSHKEIAERYVNKNPDFTILPLSVIESVQVAKAALRQGTYGYLLNEGDKWITISLSDYLSVFLTRILKEPAMFDRQCADLLTFIGELRMWRNFPYIVVRNSDGTVEIEDGAISIQLHKSEEQLIDDESDTGFQAVTAQLLFGIQAREARISTPRGEFTVLYSLLLGALRYCNIEENTDIEQEADLEPLVDWRTTEVEDLAVRFGPAVITKEESPSHEDDLRPPEQAEGEETHYSSPILGISASITSKLGELVAKAKSKFRQEEAAASTSKVTVQKEPPLQSEHDENSVPQESESTTQDSADEAQEPFWTPKRKKAAAISAGLALLFIVVGSIFLAKNISVQRQFEKFCAYVSQQDYANAYVLYRDNNFGASADECLASEIDQLILKYASNTISAEELSASLRALGNFPSIEQNLLTAQVIAAKLEASKNAYVAGKESDDVFARLSLWRQVVDLDIINYAAVQQQVHDSRSFYIDELSAKISYYSTRVRSFAAERYEVLAYWYPDSEAATYWADEYASDRTTPLSFYPVSISKVNIRQTASGYWAMHIDWRNSSVKAIREVCFSVIALDVSGNPVTNNDSHGQWTIFDARDIGPYAPGEGTPSPEYVWNYVFYGPAVAQVKLTAVNVTYEDGSTASFTEDIDLAKMYHDFK